MSNFHKYAQNQQISEKIKSKSKNSSQKNTEKTLIFRDFYLLKVNFYFKGKSFLFRLNLSLHFS